MGNGDYFPGDWTISSVQGAVIPPFTQGAVVVITEAGSTYTVAVGLASYPNFALQGTKLEGIAAGNALSIKADTPGPGSRKRVKGDWGMLLATEGQWTGDGGGGPGGDKPKPKPKAKAKAKAKARAKTAPKAKPKARKAAKGKVKPKPKPKTKAKAKKAKSRAKGKAKHK